MNQISNCIFFSQVLLQWLFLKVLDGESPGTPKIGVLSGHVIELTSYESRTNVMRIEFDSDSTVTQSGFQAKYEAVYGKKTTSSSF